MYVIACRAGSSSVASNSWGTVNHFVHGFPLRAGVGGCDVDVSLSDEDRQSTIEHHLDKCLSAESITFNDGILIATYFDWGWGVRLTVETGDCGVHVMVIHRNQNADALSFQRERQIIASAQRALASEAWYQEAFACAQECIPTETAIVPPVGMMPYANKVPVSTANSSAAHESLETGAPGDEPPAHPSSAHGDCEPPILENGAGDPPARMGGAPPDPIASDDSDSESSQCSIATETDGIDAPVAQSDAVVLEWGMDRTEHGKGLIEKHFPNGIHEADVQNLIALDELIQLRKEYLQHKSIAKKAIPRKRVFAKNRSSVLTLRLDLGRDYLEWFPVQSDEVQKHGLVTYLCPPYAWLRTYVRTYVRTGKQLMRFCLHSFHSISFRPCRYFSPSATASVSLPMSPSLCLCLCL